MLGTPPDHEKIQSPIGRHQAPLCTVPILYASFRFPADRIHRRLELPELEVETAEDPVQPVRESFPRRLEKISGHPLQIEVSRWSYLKCI